MHLGVENRLFFSLQGIVQKQAYQTSPIREVWCRSAKIATVQRIEIEDYMSQHQHDTNCNELWLYFQTVINWVKATFPKYRSKLMKGLEWGIFYNKYGTGKYDPQALEARIIELIEDYRNGYISNQQIMLMEYAKSQHFPNPTFFIEM